MSLGGALGAVSSVGGGILSAFGSNTQADQQTAQQTAAYQEKAQDAQFQAAMARRSGGYVRDLLPIQLQQQQEGFDRQLSTIRANYGASGLDMEGTPLAVLKNTVRDQAFQQDMTKFGAATTIQSYGDQARQDDRSATIYNANAQTTQDNNTSGGFLSMLGTAFGIGSSLTGNSSVRSSLGLK